MHRHFSPRHIYIYLFSRCRIPPRPFVTKSFGGFSFFSDLFFFSCPPAAVLGMSLWMLPSTWLLQCSRNPPPLCSCYCISNVHTVHCIAQLRQWDLPLLPNLQGTGCMVWAIPPSHPCCTHWPLHPRPLQETSRTDGGSGDAAGMES